ncbi:hypothetical protein ACSW9O_16195 (plasmid) [Clostridium perfringens]
MKETIKKYIENLKSEDELINMAYELEQMIKLIGKKYIEININENSEDVFIEKAFLAEEFEEKLNSLLMCSYSNIYN